MTYTYSIVPCKLIYYTPQIGLLKFLCILWLCPRKGTKHLRLNQSDWSRFLNLTNLVQFQLWTLIYTSKISHYCWQKLYFLKCIYYLWYVGYVDIFDESDSYSTQEYENMYSHITKYIFLLLLNKIGIWLIEKYILDRIQKCRTNFRILKYVEY